MNVSKAVLAAILMLCTKGAASFVPIGVLFSAPKPKPSIRSVGPSSLHSSSYKNDGPFAFMQDLLEIGGLTKEGKSIYFGVLTKDANPETTSSEEAAKLRQLAAENLTNIDDAERARRDQAGDVMIAVSAFYIIWASLFADDGGFGGHVLRMAAVMPVFVAYGYKKSAKSGL
jgi:hypothetical protein